MPEKYHASKIPELLKKITLSLPTRRSQVANWGIRLLKMNKPFSGKFMDLPMKINPLEPASRSAYFLGFYERETTAWTLEYLRREQPKLVIDVGAHFGYFVYLAIAHLKNADIYAFEPDPANMAWLKSNIEMVTTTNNVHLESMAISDQKGTVKFVPSDPNNQDSLWAGINLSQKATSKEIEVESITLDSFCADNRITEVDLVIMDIEGGEGFAVAGMIEGIKKKMYKNVLLEFHPEFLKGENAPDRIIKKFTDAGYKAFHFQAPYLNNPRSDKTSAFYDLSWKDSYLKQVDATVLLDGWEHILFKI